jgi:hypothetical protein
MLVDLAWKQELVADGKTLRVTYRVFNGGFDRVYVADAIVEARNNKFVRLPDRLIVMTAGGPGEKRPGEVLFLRGSISSDVPSMVIHPPTYAPLEAGATLEASVDLPWPLEAWHPLGGVFLLGEPQTATLKVQVLDREPPGWVELPSEGPDPIRVPQGELPVTLSGGALPLPREAAVGS